jgi:hypothetical protein
MALDISPGSAGMAEDELQGYVQNEFVFEWDSGVESQEHVAGVLGQLHQYRWVTVTLE